MAKIVVLKCENCGAMLEVDEAQNIIVCEYCGYKHLIEHEPGKPVNEGFAACPVCGRNDKVQKVSVFTMVQYSDLEKKLYLPREPEPVASTFTRPYRRKGYILNTIILIIIPGVYLIIILGAVLFIGMDKEDLGTFIWALIGPLFCVLLGLFSNKGTNMENKKIESQNIEAEREWKRKRLDYERILPFYGKMLSLWEDLYYCERDGAVYIKGSRDYTDVDQMKEYLEKKARATL